MFLLATEFEFAPFAPEFFVKFEFEFALEFLAKLKFAPEFANNGETLAIAPNATLASANLPEFLTKSRRFAF